VIAKDKSSVRLNDEQKKQFIKFGIEDTVLEKEETKQMIY
jgi:hypothetical protein